MSGDKNCFRSCGVLSRPKVSCWVTGNIDNVNNANPYWFSYPGYNELFTGYPDTPIDSNDKIPNKNISLLEFLNKKKEFAGKIAVFSTWDAFPYIFNSARSGIM